MLNLFRRFCEKFNIDEKKGEELTRISDFFSILEQQDKNNLENTNVSLQEAFLRIYNLADVSKLQYGGQNFINIFLLHIVTLKGPEKRKYAFNALHEIYKKHYLNRTSDMGDLYDNGFHYMSMSNSLLPCVDPILISACKSDVYQLMVDNKLNNQFTPNKTISEEIEELAEQAEDILLGKPRKSFKKDQKLYLPSSYNLIVDDKDAYENIDAMIRFMMSNNNINKSVFLSNAFMMENAKYDYKVKLLIKHKPELAMFIVEQILSDESLYKDSFHMVIRICIELRNVGLEKELDDIINNITIDWDIENKEVFRDILFNKKTEIISRNIEIPTNEMFAITQALMFNTNLEKLDLTGSAVGDNGAEWLAYALRGNKKLKVLHLGRNSIGAYGAEKLANALKINKTLQELNLSENDIGDVGLECFADTLRVNNSLKAIDLSFNNIGATPYVQYFANSVGRDTGLRSLSLLGNNLAPEGAIYLAEEVRYSGLEYLFLHQNQVDNAVAQAFTETLQDNNNIKLCISEPSSEQGNRYSDDVVERISQEVTECSKEESEAPEFMSISNALRTVISQEAMYSYKERMEGFLKANDLLANPFSNYKMVISKPGEIKNAITKIVEFYLSESFSEQERLDILSRVFDKKDFEQNIKTLVEKNPEVAILIAKTILQTEGFLDKLHYLVIPICSELKKNNKIDEARSIAVELADRYLSTDGKVIFLDLLFSDDTKICYKYAELVDSDMRLIFEALSYNTCLKSLELVCCNISDYAADIMHSFLRKNDTLEELNLTGNEIQDYGLRKITEALRENKRLKFLGLSNNQITDEGVAYVADLLENGANNTLKSLDFYSNNGIGPLSVETLNQALKGNKSAIEELNVYGHNAVMQNGVVQLSRKRARVEEKNDNLTPSNKRARVEEGTVSPKKRSRDTEVLSADKENETTWLKRIGAENRKKLKERSAEEEQEYLEYLKQFEKSGDPRFYKREHYRAKREQQQPMAL